MKLRLGELYLSKGVNDRIAEDQNFAEFVLNSLKRHLNGDWGDLSEEDKKENDLSLLEGFRILSAYRHSDGTKIWIITEADRFTTTILFPEEY
jgi:hypothetical protein